MGTANNSNVKSIAIMVFVSILLFGIFYYLITDVTSSTAKSDLRAETERINEEIAMASNNSTDSTDITALKADEEKNGEASEVRGDATQASVFKQLAEQKVDVKAKSVLSGTDVRDSTQSAVPETGSDTIFAAFVISCLTMFTGIYLLINQRKNKALAKFEKRIIKELE